MQAEENTSLLQILDDNFIIQNDDVEDAGYTLLKA